MNELQQFVEDFFAIGPHAWMERYDNKVPTGITADTFAEEIRSRSLELRFIDKPNWTFDEQTNLPCYLIHDVSHGNYRLYIVDRAAIEKGNFEIFRAWKEWRRAHPRELGDILIMCGDSLPEPLLNQMRVRYESIAPDRDLRWAYWFPRTFRPRSDQILSNRNESCTLKIFSPGFAVFDF